MRSNNKRLSSPALSLFSVRTLRKSRQKSLRRKKSKHVWYWALFPQRTNARKNQLRTPGEFFAAKLAPRYFALCAARFKLLNKNGGRIEVHTHFLDLKMALDLVDNVMLMK